MGDSTILNVVPLTATWTSFVDGLPGKPAHGTKFDDGGGKRYKVVKNVDGAALAVGDVVFYKTAKSSTAPADNEVVKATTATLDKMAGVCMGAPADAAWFWIQTKGDHDTALVEGTTDILIADALKGVNAQKYVVKDVAEGTSPTYPKSFMVAREGFTTNGTGNKKVTIYCDELA